VVDTGTGSGGHRYSQWWTQVQLVVDTGTASGGHRYSQWWTRIQPVVYRSTTNDGYKNSKWWRPWITDTDTVKVGGGYNGHSYCQLCSKVQTGTGTSYSQ
jgi:hypothetical protein